MRLFLPRVLLLRKSPLMISIHLSPLYFSGASFALMSLLCLHARTEVPSHLIHDDLLCASGPCYGCQGCHVQCSTLNSQEADGGGWRNEVRRETAAVRSSLLSWWKKRNCPSTEARFFIHSGSYCQVKSLCLATAWLSLVWGWNRHHMFLGGLAFASYVWLISSFSCSPHLRRP